MQEISDCGNVSTSEEKTEGSGALDSDQETSILRAEAAKIVQVKTEGSGDSIAAASVLEMKLTAQSVTTETPIAAKYSSTTTTTATTTSTTTESTTAKPRQDLSVLSVSHK